MVASLAALHLEEGEEINNFTQTLQAMVTDTTIRDMVREHLEENPGDSPETETWKDRLPFKQERLWIPPDDKLRGRILQLYHDSLMAGHQGITGTEELVS